MVLLHFEAIKVEILNIFHNQLEQSKTPVKVFKIIKTKSDSRASRVHFLSHRSLMLHWCISRHKMAPQNKSDQRNSLAASAPPRLSPIHSPPIRVQRAFAFMRSWQQTARILLRPAPAAAPLAGTMRASASASLALPRSMATTAAQRSATSGDPNTSESLVFHSERFVRGPRVRYRGRIFMCG